MKKVLSLLSIAALGLSAWAAEPVTIDLTQGESLTYTTDANWNTVATMEQDGVTLTFAMGSGDNKANFNSGGFLRIYKGNTMAVSAEENITKIEFTTTEEGNRTNVTVDAGTYNGETKTWEGEATAVTFTNPYRNGGSWDLTSMTITFAEEEQPTEPEFVFTPAAGTYTEAQLVNVTVNNKPEGCYMQVKFMGDTEFDWMRGESFNVTESGELYARLVSSEDGETVLATSAAQTYVINIPEPMTIRFNPAAGEVEAGTQVTVTVNNKPEGYKALSRMGEGSWSQYVMTYTINEAATIQVVVVPEETEADGIVWYAIPADMKAEAAYTIKQEPVVEPKIVFNPEAGEVEAGTVVTVSAEGIDYDYIIEATYNDVTKQGTTVTFELTETGNVYATILKWNESMEDYVATSVNGSARYTVVEAPAQPVINFDNEGGEYAESVTVNVTVDNMPADAELTYSFFSDEQDAYTIDNMGVYGPITITESGTLTVTLNQVIDNGDDAPRRAISYPVTKSAHYTITPATAINDVKVAEGKVTYVNVMGHTSNVPFDGVNIMIQNGKVVGKIVK